MQFFVDCLFLSSANCSRLKRRDFFLLKTKTSWFVLLKTKIISRQLCNKSSRAYVLKSCTYYFLLLLYVLAFNQIDANDKIGSYRNNVPIYIKSPIKQSLVWLAVAIIRNNKCDYVSGVYLSLFVVSFVRSWFVNVHECQTFSLIAAIFQSSLFTAVILIGISQHKPSE